MNSQLYIFGGIALILLSLFICVVSAVSLFVGDSPPPAVSFEPTDAPTPTSSNTPTKSLDSPSPTPTPTTPGVSAAEDSVSSTTPTSNSPTYTPTRQKIQGVVKTDDGGRLNVRQGPSIYYRIIDRLEDGERLAILKRNPEGNWFEIETSAQEIGWASAEYIQVLGSQPDIPVANNLAPTPTPPQSTSSTKLLELNIDGSSVAGDLAPYDEQWYTFYEEDSETILILMFDPNVNRQDSNALRFFIHDEHQIPDWPPWDSDILLNIGAGSHPPSDRDGDLGNGELIWRGGPLERDVRYYLRIVNNSTSTLRYCLATRDINEWSCAN